VNWYNTEHHHSGLAGFTPEQVFTGRYHEIAQAKQLALDSGYQNHPERFVKGRPIAVFCKIVVPFTRLLFLHLYQPFRLYCQGLTIRRLRVSYI
jgi:hypothetical protein